MSKAAPVTQDARSDARNATISATSSGLPLLPSGVFSRCSSVMPGTNIDLLSSRVPGGERRWDTVADQPMRKMKEA
jgi:hypothetical protein